MTEGAILRGIISAAMEVVVNPGKVKANPTTPIHLLFFDKLGISAFSLMMICPFYWVLVMMMMFSFSFHDLTEKLFLFFSKMTQLGTRCQAMILGAS